MSGPKTSRYTLTAEQRRILALTVNPLIKKIKLYAEEYAECREEFEALNSE